MRETASILHVDMDAFYASIEVKEDPSLAGKPVIVGGSGARGVVASCSYEARAYGIHSAMPSTQARRLCPDAVFLHGRFDLYAEYSRRIHEVFHRFTPLVESISLDEAFLDVAGAHRLFGTGPEIAGLIRQEVGVRVGLDCAVGVATTKMVAKLASKAAKPSPSMNGPVPGAGVVVVEPGQELAFLHPLPVSALWGVGPATRRRLERLGVATVGDLAAVPRGSLTGALGKSLGAQLHDLAWARDARPVEPNRPVKSISHEETYARDLCDPESVQREVVRLGDATAARMRKAEVAARTVVLKVRFHDFTTITRSHTFTAPVTSGHDVVAAASGLAAQVDPAPGVRLLGVAATNLVRGDARQLTLDDAASTAGGGDAGWDRATAAVDLIRDRFGSDAVGPARLAAGGRVEVKREGDAQWGPREGDRVVDGGRLREDDGGPQPGRRRG